MKKQKINVPAGVRYISEWKGFSLPDHQSIINKTLTGCGFTEWCITNGMNIILCSPRKILLENKEDQHKGEVFYVRNELDQVINVDKDLTALKPEGNTNNRKVRTEKELAEISSALKNLKDDIKNYHLKCIFNNIPCKILVTYDSFRHVKDALGENFKNFYVVVDEFQSIFTDSRFKSSTEMEFLNYIGDVRDLCFVSATPMIEKYLDMLDEFKDLPYYELDWESEEPGRVLKPQLEVHPCRSIVSTACNIIKQYQEGNYDKFTFTDENNNYQEIESKELVIYVNSVKNICDIIKKSNLTVDQVNVLCAKIPENIKKVRKALGIGMKKPFDIGRVPKCGETHKMFTFCTRTVYLGADFYSTNAKSIILSDSNVDCLSVDITLDLPQILGRQRLNENPWKNRAELYFKSTNSSKIRSIEELNQIISEKSSATESLLRSYRNAEIMDKHVLAEKYEKDAKNSNYKDDYVAVNKHSGKDLLPVFNNLVMVSEMRAFEIQQIDYKDRFSVFNTISNTGNYFITEGNKVSRFLIEFDKLTHFTDKMKLLCEADFAEGELGAVLDSIPITFKNYYLTLGPKKIRNLQYKNSVLLSEYEKIKNNQNNSNQLLEKLYRDFSIKSRYTRVEIKEKLGKLYNECNIHLSPKASDLERYFNIKEVLIPDSSGKKSRGYELISKKE